MYFLTLTLHFKISIGISFLGWFANFSYGLNMQGIKELKTVAIWLNTLTTMVVSVEKL